MDNGERFVSLLETIGSPHWALLSRCRELSDDECPGAVRDALLEAIRAFDDEWANSLLPLLMKAIDSKHLMPLTKTDDRGRNMLAGGKEVEVAVEKAESEKAAEVRELFNKLPTSQPTHGGGSYKEAFPETRTVMIGLMAERWTKTKDEAEAATLLLLLRDSGSPHMDESKSGRLQALKEGTRGASVERVCKAVLSLNATSASGARELSTLLLHGLVNSYAGPEFIANLLEVGSGAHSIEVSKRFNLDDPAKQALGALWPALKVEADRAVALAKQLQNLACLIKEGTEPGRGESMYCRVEYTLNPGLQGITITLKYTSRDRENARMYADAERIKGFVANWREDEPLRRRIAVVCEIYFKQEGWSGQGNPFGLVDTVKVS